MVKKTLLSLAVATALTSMVGCNVSSTDKYDNKITTDTPATQKMPVANALHPVFAPENGAVPIATDFVFAKAAATDGTADTKDTTPPVTTALNRLAGFSTTAPIYINMSEAPAPASVQAGKTVFLIKLNNAKVNPAIDALDIQSIVKNSADGNPIDVAGTMAMNNPADLGYEAEVVELTGGQWAIRILPKKPLDPKTKYIVALTDDIANASGQASGSATYQLVKGNDILPSAALGAVRNAIQAYENIAGGFLAVAQGLDASNPNIVAAVKNKIILSYAFTTDASLDDLKQYAAPGLFIKNNLTVAQAEAMTDAKAAPLTDIVARTIAVTLAAGDPSNPSQLAAVDADTIANIKKSPAYTVQLFNAIATADLGGAKLVEAAIAPAPRGVALVRPAAVDAALENLGEGLSALGTSPYVLLTLAAGGTISAPGAGDDITTRYIQGSIQLPDFLGGVAEAMPFDSTWSANQQVGGMLSAALSQPGAFPPKDVNGSTNVTYRYPFPAQVGTNSAPFLLTLPNNSAGACQGQAPFKTVIFVHGITSNRAGSAVYAAQLAKACIATVAIDLPVHGVAPADGALTMLSMETSEAAATGSPWAAVAAGAMAAPEKGGVAPIAAVNERHNSWYQRADGTRTNMVYKGDDKAGTSGSAFINLQNFTRTKDNLRQAVADLLNLNASLVSINDALKADKTLLGADAARGTLDLNNVFVAGHSLGGIVATAFVAANNDLEVQSFASTYNPANGKFVSGLPKIQGLIIANSGGHLTKLLENSPNFAPTIVGGLATGGVLQGTENFEKFLTVFQATVDGVDPANTAQQLANTPVQMFTLDGNLMAGEQLDKTVPVFDYFADSTNPLFMAVVENGIEKNELFASVGFKWNTSTSKSYLAGTQAIRAAGVADTTITAGNHSTFADGGASAMKEGQTQAAAQGAFGTMVGASVMFINANSN